MGRKKKAIAANWNAINKQRDEESKKTQGKDKKEEITPEEHQKRIQLLKDLGLVK